MKPSMAQSKPWILFWVLLTGGTALGQPVRTQPTVQVGTQLSWLRGDLVQQGPEAGFAAGLGLWRLAPGRLEWSTRLDYTYQPHALPAYDARGQRLSSPLTLEHHRLLWTTLAHHHLLKPWLHLQAGLSFGLGLGGTIDPPEAWLDPEGWVPARALVPQGNFSYGPALGIGGGNQLLKFYLRGHWDLYEYGGRTRLRLRRPFLSLGITWVVPGVEVY